MVVRRDEEYEIKAIDHRQAAKVRQSRKRLRLSLFWVSWIAFFLEVIALSVLVVYVGILSFLPALYFGLLLVAMGFLIGVQMLALRLQRRPSGTSIISGLMSIILIFSACAGFSVLRFVYGSIDKTNEGSETATVVIAVYVDKQAPFDQLSDLEGCAFGIRPEPMSKLDEAIAQIEQELDDQITIVEYGDYATLVAALRSGEIQAIILDQAMVATHITESVDSTFEQWTKTVSTHRIDQDISTDAVNVTKEPFVIYLSGLDTRGIRPVADNGLSDVNQIVVVNPKAKKILLVNTPRDTYVPLSGDPTKMDKLTHAGVYGINCSIETLEHLYDVEINHYVKVNFNSVVKIIDALGGITVHSEYNFSSGASFTGATYTFVKGPNYMTGDKALAFARQRYNLPGGDMQRGVHQQAIIRAVLEKMMSSAIVSNFSDVLNAVTEYTTTTISSEDINALIQMQLYDMATWDIQSYAMFGTGLMGTLYAFGTQDKYDVLSAPPEQVAEIKSLIQETMTAHR